MIQNYKSTEKPHNMKINKMKDWIVNNDSMSKTFTFRDFESAMPFMQKAASLISELNHHPEWSNCYNRVSVLLSTHDAGNVVTEKDHTLAALLDKVYAEF